jgi:hypothetical protein
MSRSSVFCPQSRTSPNRWAYKARNEHKVNSTVEMIMLRKVLDRLLLCDLEQQRKKLRD